MQHKHRINAPIVIAITAATIFCLIFSAQTSQLNTLYDLYGQGRFSDAKTLAESMVNASPDDPELLGIYGRILTDMSRFAEAIPPLMKAASSNSAPIWVIGWSLDYLGRCYFATGDLTNSRKMLNDCIALNATKNNVKDVLFLKRIFRFDGFFDVWTKVESDHFVLFFQPGSLVSDTAAFAKAREKTFADIDGFFGSKLPGKITVYIWNSNEDAKKDIGKTLGFSMPGLQVICQRYDQTVGHEMTHVISFFLPGEKNRTRLINEGLAVCFDGSGRDLIQSAITAARNNDMQSGFIRMLWSPESNKAPENVMYPIAGGFIKFLLDHVDKNTFLKLMSDQTPEASEKILGGDVLKSIINDYEALLLNQ